MFQSTEINSEDPKIKKVIEKDKKGCRKPIDLDEKNIKIKATALLSLRIQQLDILLKKILRNTVPIEEQKLLLFHNKRSDFPSLQWIKKQSKSPNDLENTCRVCVQPMKIAETRISLFPEPVVDNYKTDFVELNRMNLKIYRDDGLPQYICATCASQLEHINQFRLQAIRAQYILQNFFERIVKTNNLDDTIDPEQHSDGITFEFLKVEPIEMLDCSLENVRINQLISEDHDSNDKIIDLSEFEMVDSVKDLEYKCIDCQATFPEYTKLLHHQKICKKPEPQPGLESNQFVPNEQLSEHNSDSYEIKSIDWTKSTLYAAIEKRKNESNIKKRRPMKPIDPIKNYKFSKYCGICQKSFITTHKRNDHMLIHNKGNLQCLKCDRNFKLKIELTDHYNQVHPSPIICPQCDRSFRTERHLKIHLQSHGPRRQYNCQYCDRTFKQVHHLSYHENKHTGARPFLCNTCGKSFQCESSLSCHMQSCDKSHTKYKNHPCEYCNKRFNKKSTLHIHIRSHTGERPFVCDICDKSFLIKMTLKTHIKSQHIQQTVDRQTNVHQCNICNKSFRLPETLTSHIERRHVDEEERKHVCHMCKQTFKRSAHLRNHINGFHLKLRNYKCDKCEKSFYDRGALNVHIITDHDKQLFDCSYCGKKYRKGSLRKHMLDHTGVKRYQCEICALCFMHYAPFSAHKLTHESSEKNTVLPMN